MAEIFKSKDYEIFKKHESNRKLNQKNLDRIVYSIQQENMLEFRPILIDKDFRVIDGQHRLKAASILGLEIYYQIKENSSTVDICHLNANQQDWKILEFINYYISLGNENYKKCMSYCEMNKISISDFLNLTIAHRGNQLKIIKEGALKFPDENKLNEINELLFKIKSITELMNTIVISNSKLPYACKLFQAIKTIVKNPQINYNVLIEKLKIKASAIRPCADTSSYYSMIRDIYNWKNRDPIA